MRKSKSSLFKTVFFKNSLFILTLILFLIAIMITTMTHKVQAETFAWSPFMEDPPTATLTIRVRFIDPDAEEAAKPEIIDAEFLADSSTVLIRMAYSLYERDYLPGDQMRNNIVLRWHEQSECDSDILFKSSDLIRFGSNIFQEDKMYTAGSIREELFNSSIPAEAVLMARSGGEYVSLEDFNFALGSGEESSQLNFKIDESYLRNARLLPGIYRGSLESNVFTKGSAPKIIVHVENKFFADNAGEYLNLELAEGIRGGSISRSPLSLEDSTIKEKLIKDEYGLKSQPARENMFVSPEKLNQRDIEMLIDLIKHEYNRENFSNVSLENIFSYPYLNGYSVEILSATEIGRVNTGENLPSKNEELIQITVFKS